MLFTSSYRESHFSRSQPSKKQHSSYLQLTALFITTFAVFVEWKFWLKALFLLLSHICVIRLYFIFACLFNTLNTIIPYHTIPLCLLFLLYPTGNRAQCFICLSISIYLYIQLVIEIVGCLSEYYFSVPCKM